MTEESIVESDQRIISHVVLDKKWDSCNFVGQIMRLWSGEDEPKISSLSNVRILDLAAGSGLNDDNEDECWPPYFSRFCAQHGALVTVVDILPQTEEDEKLFNEVVVEDLVLPVLEGLLPQMPQLKGKKFDIINCQNFVGDDSSHPFSLEARLQVFHQTTVPEFRKKLFEQCCPLLVEGGVLFLNEEDPDSHKSIYYKKVDGRIVTVRSDC